MAKYKDSKQTGICENCGKRFIDHEMDKAGNRMCPEKIGTLKVWWIPQVPGTGFEVIVKDI